MHSVHSSDRKTLQQVISGQLELRRILHHWCSEVKGQVHCNQPNTLVVITQEWTQNAGFAAREASQHLKTSQHLIQTTQPFTLHTKIKCDNFPACRDTSEPDWNLCCWNSNLQQGPFSVTTPTDVLPSCVNTFPSSLWPQRAATNSRLTSASHTHSEVWWYTVILYCKLTSVVFSWNAAMTFLWEMKISGGAEQLILDSVVN